MNARELELHKYRIDFSKMPCAYWSDSTKISYLQRRIIVWSIMYYEHNESCVPDVVYDAVSYQLVELQNKASKEEFEKSTYYYAMYNFDASTGFDIPSRLTKYDREYLTHIANMIYGVWAKSTKQNKKKRRRSNDNFKRPEK